MRKKWLTAVFIAAIFGIVLSAISLSEYFHIQKAGLEDVSFCSIDEVVNCDIINASSYAVLFGIPVAGFGLLFYLAVAVFALFVRIAKSPKNAALSFILAVSFLGLLWTLRMAHVSAFILNAVCITCIGQYAVNIFIVIGLYAAGKISFKDRLKLIFSKKAFSPALTTIIIFGLGYIFMLSSVGGAGQAPSDNEIKELTNAHFRQSLYDIKPEDIENAPAWGNKSAKVAVIEFSDFQCPFCRLAAFNIKPYLYEFRKKIKYVFINYPLDNSCNKYIEHPMHQNACLAAQASVCANEKGKFWEYHDAVFKNQNKISRETLLNLAEKNGIEKDWMSKCIDSAETLAKIHAEIEIAHHIYLSGTPSVFINQRALRYWRVPKIMQAIIKEEIKRAK